VGSRTDLDSVTKSKIVSKSINEANFMLGIYIYNTTDNHTFDYRIVPQMTLPCQS
jgi:hypothetical protein